MQLKKITIKASQKRKKDPVLLNSDGLIGKVLESANLNSSSLCIGNKKKPPLFE